MKLQGTMEIKDNVLHIGGVNTLDLVKKYKTPLYVFDEELIRNKCREYIKSFKVKENGNKVAYAGKAFLTKYMCKLVCEEGLCLDVVSGGELYTAYKAGMPMENILFHGNNKTVDEVKLGIELGVGRFVVDNFYELDLIEKFCLENNKTQKIYFRVTPGIDAHTHKYIRTGQIDSKFGFALINGDFYKAVEKVKQYKNIELVGIHAHIGSQIFEIKPFLDEVEIMLKLLKEVNENNDDINLTEVDLGGGIGVYYTEEDKPKTISEFCEAIINKADEVCEELNIKRPTLLIEPGRSLVANAGSTIYTVGSIKEIKNVRTYVSVDGGMTDNLDSLFYSSSWPGMTDNIRPSLYQADYECGIVNKINKTGHNHKVTIAGKCCESGDILISDTEIGDINSGDILITTTTGAYGYSMASNYNKIPKNPVVFVQNGEDKLACKRQSYEDLLALEV